MARARPRKRTASTSSSAITRTSCAAWRSPGSSLIFYGLGNFLHHGTADITGKGICRDYGLMARVHLKHGADGKLELRAVEAIPVTDTHFRPRR